MDIGSTHIDGNELVAGALVILSLIGLFLLRNRPQPPIEHPLHRAVRLAQAAGLHEGTVYFVPDDENEVVLLKNMEHRSRVHHSGGRLIRLKNGHVQFASVRFNQDPQGIRDNMFWNA